MADQTQRKNEVHEGFRDGERVEHPEYGEGKVSHHPEGLDTAGRVCVWFDDTPETTTMRVRASKLERVNPLLEDATVEVESERVDPPHDDESSMHHGGASVELDFAEGVEYDVDDHGDGSLTIQYWEEPDYRDDG